MLPRLSLDTPTVAVCPLAVFGGPDDEFDVPPPPQPATASAASRSTAPPAANLMDLLSFIVVQLLSNLSVVTENSVAAELPRGISGTGPRALPLTAVLEFMLACS
jgi:hypothetical protein